MADASPGSVTRLIHVKVTEKHIREGRPGNASCCPIALALSECGLRARVGTRKVAVEVEAMGWIVKYIWLPDAALSFVQAFDNLNLDDNGNILPGQTLPEPIEFDLDESKAW